MEIPSKLFFSSFKNQYQKIFLLTHHFDTKFIYFWHFIGSTFTCMCLRAFFSTLTIFVDCPVTLLPRAMNKNGQYP